MKRETADVKRETADVKGETADVKGETADVNREMADVKSRLKSAPAVKGLIRDLRRILSGPKLITIAIMRELRILGTVCRCFL